MRVSRLMGASWVRPPLALEMTVEQLGPQSDQLVLGLGTESRPVCRDELGCPCRKLNDEVQFATLQAALEHGEGLAAEGMMASRNAHMLDVIGIQPRSMLVVVVGATPATPR